MNKFYLGSQKLLTGLFWIPSVLWENFLNLYWKITKRCDRKIEAKIVNPQTRFSNVLPSKYLRCKLIHDELHRGIHLDWRGLWSNDDAE